MPGKKKLSDMEILTAVENAASQKGLPWSESEFNGAKSSIRENLKLFEATKRQLKMFDKLVREAPIKGGCFNRWSGD